MKAITLPTKLTLLYTAAFAVVLSALSLFFYNTLASRIDSDITEELESNATGLRGYLRFPNHVPTLVFDDRDPEQVNFVRTAGRYYELYDAATGELLLQSSDMALLDLDLNPDEVHAAVRRLGTDEIENERVSLRFHNSLVKADARHSYLLRVGASLTPIQSTLERFLRTLLWLVPAGIALAAIFGYLMARLALRPVRKIQEAAHRITIHDLHTRLPLAGSGDEIDQLSHTFNETLDRLQKSVDQMKQFTAAISHELRTPLAALQGEAEVALMHSRTPEHYRAVLSSQLEEFQKLTRMVNNMLLLARAEAGDVHPNTQPVDLASISRAMIEMFQPIAADKGVQLTLNSSPTITVQGDPLWLERMLMNLVENALKYTPRQGSVHVELSAIGDSAVLTITDTGIGISEENLPHIFERFYRADASRSREIEGAGVGLAIVRWVVESHGGQISVQSRTGEGTRFQVKLPAVLAPEPAQK
jgi:heavy metal sensor kinase